jgi:hypothetical protein
VGVVQGSRKFLPKEILFLPLTSRDKSTVCLKRLSIQGKSQTNSRGGEPRRGRLSRSTLLPPERLAPQPELCWRFIIPEMESSELVLQIARQEPDGKRDLL